MPSPYERKTSFDMGALPCADAGRLLPQGGGCQELKTLPLPERVLQVTGTCPTQGLRLLSRPACRSRCRSDHRRSDGFGGENPPLAARKGPSRRADPRASRRRVPKASTTRGCPPEDERGEGAVRAHRGSREVSAFFPRTPPRGSEVPLPSGQARGRGTRRTRRTARAGGTGIAPPSARGADAQGRAPRPDVGGVGAGRGAREEVGRGVRRAHGGGGPGSRRTTGRRRTPW
ncbi:hypothetical protein F750_2626 [Streptomyces sp. PAMC 26508]|nr:hypothetical protein F750_2626 [Streptomyces sp. PAMC 26508]